MTVDRADPAQMPVTIPAATLVLFRHAAGGGPPELMMQDRAAHMRFAAGATVFPGGRVDPADRDLACQIAPDLDPDDGAARVAAIRETLEETGLLIGVNRPVTAELAIAARAVLAETGDMARMLEHFALSLDPAALIPFARWCPHWDGAFDTRFYLADLGTGNVTIAEDASESTRLHWSSAAETLRLIEQGELSALFPTICNLQRLACYQSFAEARAHALSIPPQRITPWSEQVDGTDYLCIPDDQGYPLSRLPSAGLRRGRR